MSIKITFDKVKIFPKQAWFCIQKYRYGLWKTSIVIRTKFGSIYITKMCKYTIDFSKIEQPNEEILDHYIENTSPVSNPFVTH